jgi:hypothetical protein
MSFQALSGRLDVKEGSHRWNKSFNGGVLTRGDLILSDRIVPFHFA